MIELLNLRQENSKTYDLGGNKRQLVASIGAIHFKDDYASDEQWKDIDLTWVGNKITKAPYELTLDGTKLTLKNKKSSEVTTIELWEVKPPGMKWEIIPENTRVSFRHILPSDKIPFEAKFKLTGKGLITTKAFDDEGELVLDMAVVGDTFTEKLNEVRDKQTGKIRPAKGNIRIDPTWQVGASSDDCVKRILPDYFSSTLAICLAGANAATGQNWGSGARFLNITIPAGSTINSAGLILTCGTSGDTIVVNTRLRAQANINPATFSNQVDFDNRTWTTVYVNWDAIPAWILDTEYTSSDIKTCIQEVINLSGWASGNPMAVLWDDFQQRSTQATGKYRQGYSYDGSATYAPKLVITYTVPGVTHYGAATLSGVGTLSGNGVITAVGKASLSGTGSLSSIGHGIFAGKATLSGSGSLSAMLRKINRRYGTKVPNETSIITTKPIGSGRYG